MRDLYREQMALKRQEIQERQGKAAELVRSAEQTRAESLEAFAELLPMARQIARIAIDKGIRPDVQVVDRNVTHKARLLPDRLQIERPAKVKRIDIVGRTHGWLLARNVFIAGTPSKSRLYHEEAALGTDGQIHLYLPAKIPANARLLNNPMTCSKIGQHYSECLLHPAGFIELSKTTAGRPAITQIAASEEFFEQVAGYEGSTLALQPEVIAEGLAEFSVEHDIEI